MIRPSSPFTHIVIGVLLAWLAGLPLFAQSPLSRAAAPFADPMAGLRLEENENPEPEECLDNWDPVCGADGVTYSNACHAEEAGTSVACQDVCPCPDPAPVPIPKLIIEPRQVVVLEEAGQSYQFTAYWEGSEEPAAGIVWESSDSKQVIVEGGYARALTDDAYAVITARSALDIVHEPAYASVMVAKLQPELIQLPESLVQSVQVVSLEEEKSVAPFDLFLEVDITPATLDLRVGDVVVFDDHVGIDIGFVSVDEKAGIVTLRGYVPNLDQVYSDLRVELDSRALQKVSSVLIEAEEAKLRRERESKSGFACAFQLVPEIGGDSLVYIDIQDGRLQTATFLVEALLGLTVPSFDVDTRINCHLDLPSIPVGTPVPILPLTLGVFGYAAVGGDLVFDVTDGFTTNTPSASASTLARGGFEYRDGEVIFPGEVEEPATDYDLGALFFGPSEADVSIDLSAYIEAGTLLRFYVGPAIDPDLALLEVRATVLRFTLGRHFSLPLQASLGPDHPDYLGPVVSDYFDAHFWVLKNIGTGNQVNKVLKKIGVEGANYEAPGWEIYHFDYFHPRPTLASTAGQVFVGGSNGYPPSAGISTELSEWIHPFLPDPIDRVEVWRRPMPDGDFESHWTRGDFNYTPTSADVGNWQLRAMAYNADFGPHTDGFPTESNIIDLEVAPSPVIQLDPTSVQLSTAVTLSDEVIFTATNTTQQTVTYDLRLLPEAPDRLYLDAEGAFTLGPEESRIHGIGLDCDTAAESGEGHWLAVTAAGQNHEFQHPVSYECVLLDIDPESLFFSMAVGESETRTVTLTNRLAPPLEWYVANGGSTSLSITPLLGTLLTVPQEVTITASCDSAGRTETSIVFAGRVGSTSPELTQELPITLNCADEGGDTWGDPHLVTFDDVAYDFQAKGEFVLSRGSVGDFEVQTRQVPRGNSAVTLNKAVALKVGGQRVAFYIDPPVGGGPLMVDGEVESVADGETLALANGGRIEHDGDVHYVRWPGSEAYVRIRRGHGSGGYFNVFVRPDAVHGNLVGLLGDNDGDGGNDFRLRNGVGLPSPPSFDHLYDCSQGDCFAYDDPYGWLVRSETLFDYSPDEGPETFEPAAGELYPPGPVSLDDFPADQVEWAVQACLDAGITLAELVEACALDILVTGDIEMGTSAGEVQASSGNALVPGFECSSEFRPDWCAKVMDNDQGKCNRGEWATATQPTGWVRIRFARLETVEKVALFDRACTEQVSSGRIVFGDGSPAIAFGALPDDGKTALEIDVVPPRTVTWIEVHLDTTNNPEPDNQNPGLGEVVINDGTVTVP